MLIVFLERTMLILIGLPFQSETRTIYCARLEGKVPFIWFYDGHLMKAHLVGLFYRQTFVHGKNIASKYMGIVNTP